MYLDSKKGTVSIQKEASAICANSLCVNGCFETCMGSCVSNCSVYCSYDCTGLCGFEFMMA